MATMITQKSDEYEYDMAGAALLLFLCVQKINWSGAGRWRNP